MKNAIFVTMASVSLNINYLFLHMNTKKITFGALEKAEHTSWCSAPAPSLTESWAGNLLQFFSLSQTPALLCVVVLGGLTTAAQDHSHTFMLVLRVRCHRCCSALSLLMSPRFTFQ